MISKFQQGPMRENQLKQHITEADPVSGRTNVCPRSLLPNIHILCSVLSLSMGGTCDCELVEYGKGMDCNFCDYDI